MHMTAHVIITSSPSYSTPALNLMSRVSSAELSSLLPELPPPSTQHMP